ncbi:LptF/LptG family permease [Arcobacter aquimarinus]|uniref:Lipooligosaccharide transport system, ABC transporter permease component LptF n=1 Tax=Arcobacter aquimarinus TaxID=1315211 RepID=A0AAE7B7I4_9BACT|nr:LptF/LptG family permease [Arcobacter aquimarinus]QKE27057.1 lipooligosaccharide transport system, ABC transporter permease component LptF [Arcobacter aquimarinus]RXI36879.1 permease [Arcobacter aquimarinus]
MKLNHYLHSQLAITFFPIFLGLYFITSIVFLVRIASLTSVITMDFIELFTLYSYVIPQIIFYTMPISFFLSMVITLAKLSSEYELTVITSFGLNPVKILKIFLPITFLVSLLLLVVSLGLIPKTKFLSNQFLDLKKKEANFNIKASEFGQKFGDWLIYISDKNDKVYKDVKLFKTENNKDQFIVSKTAILDNDKGNLSFRLIDGKTFIFDNEEFNQIDYESMYINETINNKSAMFDFQNSFDYWILVLSHDMNFDEFASYVLSSIFPLISLFLIITFGYFNPRYEKNRAVFYSLLAVVSYYVLIKIIGDKILLHAIYIIPIIWIGGTYLLYSRTIQKEY